MSAQSALTPLTWAWMRQGVASIWQVADFQTFRISKPLHTGRSDSVTGEWTGHTVRAMAADSR
jgi:hypothetical protein